MMLKELLTSIPFYSSDHPIEDTPIHSIQMNDQLVQQNDLFVCIRGVKHDGHQFAKRAVEKGATVIIAEDYISIEAVQVIYVRDTVKALAQLAAHFYRYPSNDIYMTAITGTNGKTTTTYLLKQILQMATYTTGLIGTIQVTYHNKTHNLSNTTPNALELQRILMKMKQENVTDVIMEASSHGIRMGRLYGCDLNIVIFTNLSQDHLDFHKTMEEYAYSKSLLFSRLGNSYGRNKKFVILNRDDLYYKMMKEVTAHPVLTYGFYDNADIYVEEVHYSMKETQLTIQTPVGRLCFTTKLIGKFNVYNILAAVSAAIAKNVPLRTIQQAMSICESPPGRLERLNGGQLFHVVIDYAHSPDSLDNLLQTIQQVTKGRMILVIGAGGNRDRTKRPIMAEVAMKYCEHIIFTSDNPRDEDPKQIIHDMVSPKIHNHYEIMIDREKAIFRAIQMALKEDVVIIAGKGHENYQEIRGEYIPFDDKQIAQKAITYAIQKNSKRN